MILLLEMFKKHPHNQCFLVRGLAFIMKKSEPLIIKVFGQGFYAVLDSTGQQYISMNKARKSSAQPLQLQARQWYVSKLL